MSVSSKRGCDATSSIVGPICWETLWKTSPANAYTSMAGRYVIRRTSDSRIGGSVDVMVERRRTDGAGACARPLSGLVGCVSLTNMLYRTGCRRPISSSIRT